MFSARNAPNESLLLTAVVSGVPALRLSHNSQFTDDYKTPIKTGQAENPFFIKKLKTSSKARFDKPKKTSYIPPMKKKGTINQRTRPWTTAEEDRLRLLYPIRHNTELEKRFGRSANAIKKKARKLGLEKDYEDGYRSPNSNQIDVWTEGEIKTLKHLYPYRSAETIAERLDRTPEAIRGKAKKLRLKKAQKWTPREIDYLKSYYLEKGAIYIAEQLGRTPKAVRIKAMLLKLTRSRKPSVKRAWTEKEDKLLKNLYSELTTKQVAEKLGRSMTTVRGRAGKLGLVKQERWTPEEEQQLIALYPTHTYHEISKIMGKPLHAIKGKSQRLILQDK